MSATRPFALFCAVACIAAACSRQPELDLTAGGPARAAAAPAANAAAPPITPGAELPPGHPPLDAAAAARPAVPPGHPDIPAEASAARPLSPGTTAPSAPLAWTAPPGWVEEPPANSVRHAQYRVPGAGGDAECVVFNFGVGQGGEPQANAQRWASQFAGADGAPAPPRTRPAEVGGMEVLYVEAEGTYREGAMTGGAVVERPGYALLAAVVSAPDSEWFFKLTGPKATIEAQRASFETLIGSLRRGDAG